VGHWEFGLLHRFLVIISVFHLLFIINSREKTDVKSGGGDYFSRNKKEKGNYKMNLEKRVNRGIDWLDENIEGWRDKIKIEKLDIGSARDCILGQLLGSYGEKKHFGLNKVSGVILGFNATEALKTDYNVSELEFQHGELTKIWKDKLGAR
jgi:hypothetical protein